MFPVLMAFIALLNGTPTPIQIGGLALILGLLTFAQRLGAWENKHLARLLVAIAAAVGVAWLFLFVPIMPASIGAIIIAVLIGMPARRYIREYRQRQSRNPTSETSCPSGISPIPETGSLIAPLLAVAGPLRVASAPSATASDARCDGRIIIDETPDYLWSLFRREYTSIQAHKLIEAYLGKWMRVSGSLGDIMGTSHIQVTFAHGSFREVIFMYFSPELHDRLAVLKRGTKITVIGKIQEVNMIELHLGECELEIPSIM